MVRTFSFEGCSRALDLPDLTDPFVGGLAAADHHKVARHEVDLIYSIQLHCLAHSASVLIPSLLESGGRERT